MDKSSFIRAYHKTVRRLGLTSAEVTVSSGGALLMLGLRNQTSDLDLDVPETTFVKYRTSDNFEMFGTSEIVNLSDTVSLHVADPLRETMVVAGVTCYSIPELIKQKKALLANPARRPEKIAADKRDLAGLEGLLKASSSPRSSAW